ncbi:MAG: cupin domain-containing protein [Elusimicrobiota bacterium]|jgi:quercetin dioxygenase-like cupin family protein
MILRFCQKKKQYRWGRLPVLAYKEEGTHFKRIRRQILFGEAQGFCSQLRYFEIASGGHSTLERHRHVHGVMILRGTGKVLIGKDILTVRPFDILYIPPRQWHQFRAGSGPAFGFLCLVNCDRDRPERPTVAALKHLCRTATVSRFIRT